MKKLSLVFGLVLMAGLCAGILGRSGVAAKKFAPSQLRLGQTDIQIAPQAGSVHDNAFNGAEINGGRPDAFTLAGETESTQKSNALPGHYTITIRFNRATAAVIGGDWVLTVFQPGGDGGPVEVGTLHGTVESGSVSLAEDGRVTAVNDVQLIVSGGNADYSGVNTGTGSFAARPNEAPAQDQSGISPAAERPVSAPQANLREVSPTSAESLRPGVPSEHGARSFKGTLTITF